ncbi:AAEL005841-PA [Aedes aegypti]|uniref:AAEL005841-PA n=1 Tax=Aedes aegypti TaxID=7159 RepID=Q178J9_AEDAE|nr:AAEL005841-PA [Aedes aegypti]
MIEQGMIEPFQHELHHQQHQQHDSDTTGEQQHHLHDIDFANQHHPLTQVVQLSSPLAVQQQNVAKRPLPSTTIVKQQQQQIVQLQPRQQHHTLPNSPNSNNSGSVTIFVIKTVLPDE